MVCPSSVTSVTQAWHTVCCVLYVLFTLSVPVPLSAPAHAMPSPPHAWPSRCLREGRLGWCPLIVLGLCVVDLVVWTADKVSECCWWQMYAMYYCCKCAAPRGSAFVCQIGYAAAKALGLCHVTDTFNHTLKGSSTLHYTTKPHNQLGGRNAALIQHCCSTTNNPQPLNLQQFQPFNLST